MQSSSSNTDFHNVDLSGSRAPRMSGTTPKPQHSFDKLHSNLPLRRGFRWDSGMYGYPRTLYVCVLAPESKELRPDPSNYEYSLLIGSNIPSNEGMVHHFLRSEPILADRRAPRGSIYKSAHLDLTGVDKRMIAFVNMSNVYTIVQEEGIEDVISDTGASLWPQMWVQNVIRELVVRRFLSPTNRDDTTETVFRELKVATQQFLATVTRDYRELARKGALGPQRTIPTFVLRSSQASRKQVTGQPTGQEWDEFVFIDTSG